MQPHQHSNDNHFTKALPHTSQKRRACQLWREDAQGKLIRSSRTKVILLCDGETLNIVKLQQRTLTLVTIAASLIVLLDLVARVFVDGYEMHPLISYAVALAAAGPHLHSWIVRERSSVEQLRARGHEVETVAVREISIVPRSDRWTGASTVAVDLGYKQVVLLLSGDELRALLQPS